MLDNAMTARDGTDAAGCHSGKASVRQAEEPGALLIFHRLDSARLADRILVLDGGRIVEEGSHGELMKRSGLYTRMLGTQAQWYA
jgi:ABC-type multidrug transport system fused ATPase/permease subunit